MTTNMIPDATGTVMVSGHESLAMAYALKDSFLRTLTEEVDGFKRQIRSIAQRVAAEASAAGEVRRIFLRNGQRGGVGVSLPDITKDGNRLALSDKKLNDVLKLGELATLGVPQSELIEEEITEAGGEVIVLRGRWVEWFKQHMSQHLTGDADVEHKTTEKTVVRKLKASAVSVLRRVSAGGGTAGEMADLLLSLGLRDMSVKAEEK